MKDLARPKKTTTFRVPLVLAHEMLDYLHDSKLNPANCLDISEYCIEMGKPSICFLPWTCQPHLQDAKKVVVDAVALKKYWAHWAQYMPPHDAMTEAKHVPIGFFGDDARWSLAGSKIIVLLLNHLLFKESSWVVNWGIHHCVLLIF